MFSTIMVPVDLAHLNLLDKALRTAAELAKHYNATVYYVGVTASAPSQVAHNPSEYTLRLEQLAAEQASHHGISARAKAMISHDPSIELDSALRHAGEEIGRRLIAEQVEHHGRL